MHRANERSKPACCFCHTLETNWSTDSLRAFFRTLLVPGWPQATVYSLWLLHVHQASANEIILGSEWCCRRHDAIGEPWTDLRGFGGEVYGMYLPCFLCDQRKWGGLISGQRGHVFPELLSIMSKHTSFCRHFICSLSPHQGLGLSPKQWAQESRSLLHNKSGSHLDNSIYLSRHTRHVSGITCWNNAVLIAIQVNVG